MEENKIGRNAYLNSIIVKKSELPKEDPIDLLSKKEIEKLLKKKNIKHNDMWPGNCGWNLKYDLDDAFLYLKKAQLDNKIDDAWYRTPYQTLIGDERYWYLRAQNLTTREELYKKVYGYGRDEYLARKTEAERILKQIFSPEKKLSKRYYWCLKAQNPTTQEEFYKKVYGYGKEEYLTRKTEAERMLYELFSPERKLSKLNIGNNNQKQQDIGSEMGKNKELKRQLRLRLNEEIKVEMDKTKAKPMFSMGEVFIRAINGVDDLEDMVKALLRAKVRGENVYEDYFGVRLYSADVTMDNAYQAVYGCTKAEYDKKQQMENQPTGPEMGM